MRWRRRWFTLKQGEIPEQFCLEYYTDRNCRRLKGVIDLDQCEQVDCGLRLENRKQKFQFMFDIKTPKRTYYLAADSAEDMRDWVNCICQVCHLHDTKHSMEEYERSSTCERNHLESIITSDNAESEVNLCNKGLNSDREICVIPCKATNKCHNVYQNNDSNYVNAKYRNTEFKNDLSTDSKADDTVDNIGVECTHLNNSKTYLNTSVLHPRKLPEKLILQSRPLPEVYTLGNQPSTLLSNSSGAYIPISECFSGTPKHLENPVTPLNNLDPKFYDTPRSHNNIGLNLTNDQSHSPKITNCTSEQMLETKNHTTTNNRSDSDSESVFTDDDEWTYPMPLRENIDRATRPSDSSFENESFVLTYSQRFSKLPDDVIEKENYDGKIRGCETAKVHKLMPNFSLDIKQNEKISQVPQLSDTENTSPAIGPEKATSIIDESYDIPRSHQLPYHNIDEMFNEQIWSPKTKISLNSVTSSACSKTETQATLQKHFYTNAAPNKIEGNVFRYDFIDQTDVPPVNRELKPRMIAADKLSEKFDDNTITDDNLYWRPPSVDRNLKPKFYKSVSSYSMEQVFRHSVDGPPSMIIPVESENCKSEIQTLPRSSYPHNEKNRSHTAVETSDVQSQRSPSISQVLLKTKPLATFKGDEPLLQYFDLDLANPPTVNRQSINASSLIKLEPKNTDSIAQTSLKSGVVYNSVDFVKTEAFKRIREERKKESESVNTELKTSK